MSAKKKTQKKSESMIDDLQMLMNTPINSKKKNKEISIKRQDYEITDDDDKDEIIKKLVLNVKALWTEFSAYKQHIDETFCTYAIHNRCNNDVEKRIDDLQSVVDNLDL